MIFQKPFFRVLALMVVIFSLSACQKDVSECEEAHVKSIDSFIVETGTVKDSIVTNNPQWTDMDTVFLLINAVLDSAAVVENNCLSDSAIFHISSAYFFRGSQFDLKGDWNIQIYWCVFGRW